MKKCFYITFNNKTKKQIHRDNVVSASCVILSSNANYTLLIIINIDIKIHPVLLKEV